MGVVSRHNQQAALANCLSSDGAGSMVYISGPKVDGRYQVESCDPSDYSKMPAIGMIIHKLDTTTCIVQFRGIVDSVYGSLVPGERLFVDDGGGLSDTPPEPTVGVPSKYMQDVAVALADDTLDLNPNYMIAKRRY